jgi:hypothetical protein
MSAAQKRELEGFRALSKISLELQAGGDRFPSSTIMLGMVCACRPLQPCIKAISTSIKSPSAISNSSNINKHQHYWASRICDRISISPASDSIRISISQRQHQHNRQHSNNIHNAITININNSIDINPTTAPSVAASKQSITINISNSTGQLVSASSSSPGNLGSVLVVVSFAFLRR